MAREKSVRTATAYAMWRGSYKGASKSTPPAHWEDLPEHQREAIDGTLKAWKYLTKRKEKDDEGVNEEDRFNS